MLHKVKIKLNLVAHRRYSNTGYKQLQQRLLYNPLMIDVGIEKYTKQIIFSDLKKGDPDWDIPHTTAVVHYTKEIIKHSNLDLDPTVLVISAYAHDWGYVPFYKPGKSLSFDEYKEAKKSHADISAQKTNDLLKNEVYIDLTNQRKQRIIHLVAIHDKKDQLKDTDELTLMEADTLGGLDLDFVIPSFDAKGNSKYMTGIREKRLPLFINDYSKNKFEELFKKREEYYASKN